MTKRWMIVALIAPVALLLPACGQPVELPAVFSDHAVLQRNMEIPVWGKAAPGYLVAVEFAGQRKTTVAGDEGDWIVRLDPVPAGGPYTLTVATELTAVTREDILVGDVWICSGQSNMAWPVSRANNPTQEVADANYPGIRLFTVPRGLAVEPQWDVDGQWTPCTPDNAAGFSAVGYYFGRELHRRANVPVGLINTSWGGTRAQPWTPRRYLEGRPEYNEMLAEYDEKAGDPDQVAQKLTDHRRAMERYQRQWDELLAGLSKLDRGLENNWAAPGLDPNGWKTMTLPTLWEQAGLKGFDGVVWFRREVDLPADWAGKDCLLSLGAIDDDDRTYVNGVQVGHIGYGDENHWQTPRKYTVPGRLIQPGRNVIAVRVFDGGGGGGIYGRPERMRITPADRADLQGISLTGEWQYRIGYGGEGEEVPQRPRRPGQFRGVGYIWNAMVAPLVPYGISGAIWYQGESNAGEPQLYARLFPDMIRFWRRRWGQGDFPFLFVQLANFMAPSSQPASGGWARIREAQAEALKLPATAMAVAIDIGEADDIHPRNKQEVGRRLALAALARALDREVVYSGPIYEGMSVEGNKVRIRFRHVDGGLVARGQGGELKGFAIAGQDRNWVWAEAKIAEDKPGTVLVWSPKVANPAAVRYAWASNPDKANLYNAANLPAAPFRTDDWPPPARLGAE